MSLAIVALSSCKYKKNRFERGRMTSLLDCMTDVGINEEPSSEIENRHLSYQCNEMFHWQLNQWAAQMQC